LRVLLASIYPFVFLLLFFTIPFDMYFRALPNILLVVLAVVFPFIIQKKHLRKLTSRSSILWLCFFGALLLAEAISGNIMEDMAILKKIALALALVILYLPIENFKKLYKAIIFSSIAAILFSLVKLFLLLNQGYTFGFLESATIVEAILVDRIYLGFLSVISILASYQLLRKEYHPDNRYYLANITLNVLFILFIVSRIAIITLLLIFILSLFYSKKRGSQLLFAVGGIFLIAVLVFVVNQDLRKKIFYAQDAQKNQGLIANTMAYEPRTVIWDCAWKNVSGTGVSLTGMGFVGTNQKMMDCYENNIANPVKSKWFLKQKYNVHNQFLDTYLGGGILVFLLLMISLGSLFFENRKHFFPTALLLSLFCFAMVENVFHRQIGAYYVGFILLTLLINKHSENEKEVIKGEIP